MDVRLDALLSGLAPGFGCNVVKMLLNSLLSRRACSWALRVNAPMVLSAGSVLVSRHGPDLDAARGLSLGRLGYSTGIRPLSSSSSLQASSMSGSLMTNAEES